MEPLPQLGEGGSEEILLADIFRVGELVEKISAGIWAWIVNVDLEGKTCAIKHVIGGEQEIVDLDDIWVISSYSNTGTCSSVSAHLTQPPSVSNPTTQSASNIIT